MATSAYMNGRSKYARPQAILWSENSGTLINGLYVPIGYEVNANPGLAGEEELNQFLILSDDNRSPIDISPNRIQKRERMINGRMRSYHIADKMNIDISWTNLPSRSHYLNPDFNSTGATDKLAYTSDNGAGGVEILDWYENHKGSFWMFLSYDKYNTFGKDDAAYGHLPQYSQLLEVSFADFNYSVVKRGATNFDLWNISLKLEES